MALFGIGKKKLSSAQATEGKEEKKQVQPNAPALRSLGEGGSHAHVLRHARITEKATMHSSESVYTFDVETDATKRDIIAAIRSLYKVTPEKIAIVTIPSKIRRNVRTGKTGLKKGGKKAYIYLKKGETITIS